MAVSVRSRLIIGSATDQISPIRAVKSRWSLMRTSTTSWRVSLVVTFPPRVTAVRTVTAYPWEGDANRGSRLVQAETDLHRHLDVPDLAVLQVTTDLGHLEPVEIVQCLRGALDAVADRLVDTVGRAADD